MHKLSQLLKIGVMSIVLCLLGGCNADEYDKLREENKKIVSESRLLKDRLYELEAREQKDLQLVRELEIIQRKEKEAKIGITDIEEYHRDLKSAIKYTTSLVHSWKIATRKSLIGRPLGSLRMTAVSISNAVIIELTPEMVVLKYDKGQSEFNLADLPEQARKKLIHEPTILLESEIVN